MPLTQSSTGALLGEDRVPIPPDAVLIFETDVQGPDGHPLPPLYVHSGANSIKWSYQLNTFQTSTLGGEVVQVLSAFVGPMTIEGLTAGYDPTKQSVPIPGGTAPGWTTESYTPVDELMDIANWFLAYMQATGLGDPGAQFRDERTIRFRYPIRDWDFRIWVTELNGFRIDKDVTAIPWSITAEIMSDNALDYFAGTTMASMQGSLNDRMLQVAISPGYEFATNPFVNPSLAQNDPNNTAKNIGAQFQGLVGAWATGDFMTWGFSSLAIAGGRNDYNKKALPQGYQETSGLSHPQNFGALAHPIGDNAGLNKGFGVNKYWIGGAGGQDYVVNSSGYQGPGSDGGGGGGGGGGGQPPPPPSGGGNCGDSSCYNKANVKINNASALALAIDDWMRKQVPNSPLIGQGSLIVSLAQKYNINPFLYPVVALIESSLGTDCCHHDNGNHNTWGDLTNGGADCVSFGSFVEATQAYFQNLATNSAYSGDATVCDVINTASPPSANPGYLDKALGLLGGIISDAGSSVDCGGTKPPPPPTSCKNLGQKVVFWARQIYAMRPLHYDEARPIPKVTPPTPPPYLDCSGFAEESYRLAGCDIFGNGANTYNMVTKGEDVSRDNLQEGDLIYYNTPGGQNAHMGIYIGGGQIMDHGHEGGPFINPIDIYPIYAIRRYCKDCGVS